MRDRHDPEQVVCSWASGGRPSRLTTLTQSGGRRAAPTAAAAPRPNRGRRAPFEPRPRRADPTTQAAAPRPAPSPDNGAVERADRKWLILSAVSIGTFMATLDGSIVNISLPSMQADFAVPLAAVEWVVVAYLLALGSLLLPFGRLGELLTFKQVYLAGFALFTVASILCGAAPGPVALIGFRVVQGVGAAMLQAMGPAIVARTFGPGERGRALGINAISVSIGLSLGPALGGFLTQVGSWRAIFLVNAPVGLFAILWAARILPVERPGGRQPFDLRGAALRRRRVRAPSRAHRGRSVGLEQPGHPRAAGRRGASWGPPSSSSNCAPSTR